MVTFVFDSSAAVRYLDDKAGAARVEQILQDRAHGDATLLVSAIQWGEIARIICKRHGAASVPKALLRFMALGFEVIPVIADQAVRSAILQQSLKLPYADAFVIALAQEHELCVLITADFDFKVADHLTTIEFLPPNPD
jgi:predicted nucleic acid-binding protein